MKRSTPRERLAFLLADAEVAVVITQQALLADLPESSAACVCLDQDASLIAAYPDALPTFWLTNIAVLSELAVRLHDAEGARPTPQSGLWSDS